MATWKKVAVSGSNISQFNNDSGYITSVTAQHAFTTASFNGTELFADSSQGNLTFASGSGAGLNITANAGTDTLTFTLNNVPNSSLANSTISGISLGSDLNDLTVDNATLTLDSGTTYNGSAAKTISVKDGGIDTDAIADSLGTIGVNSFTGSFSGSFTGDVNIDLADLTPGDGLFGSAYDGNAARTFSVDSGSLAGNGLTTSGGTFVVENDGSTITVGASGIKVTDGGIGTTQIADSLGILGENEFTGSFTGSFTGDGSGLTGITADTLANALTDTAGGGLTDFSFDGSSAVNIAVSGAADLTDNTVVKWDNTSNKFANTIATDDGSTFTITGDSRITGDLTVQGTASFQNTTELQVADRFILMASGSNTAGDGGIVIQQGTQNIGEVFGFDSATTRFGLTGSFNASDTAFTPDAFMAAVVNTAGNDPNGANAPDTRYEKKGNLYVANDSEDIWIYS
jgi:hypothetical protein